MKQNLLKIILLGSTLTMSLCGCGEKPTEPTQQPTTEQLTEQPTTEEPTTEEVTSEEPTTEEKPSEPVVEANPPRIQLARQIYIEGEDAYGDLLQFDIYSNALKDYKSRLNTATVEMPAECPNGEAFITISSGRDSVEYPIYYYKDAATAAAMTEINIPEDTSAIFDEESYIKDGTLKFKSVVDTQGNLYVERGSANATKQNASVANITYNGNGLEVWSDTTKMQAGVYDASKFTLNHYVEEGVGDHYHVTKEPTFGEGMSIPTLKMYEIITDADGRICYLAQTFHSSANWALAGSETGYWSYYKNFRENPAFSFAEDYDPETNPTAFQKVLPEGGRWYVGYNSIPANLAGIDKVWQLISGTNTTIYSAGGVLALTMEDAAIEQALLNARISHTTGRKVSVLNAADTYELYAYYYSLALASGDASLLEYRDDIYEAIIKQQLPEVKAEPILFGYYEGITMSKLVEWASKFNTAE